MIENKRVGIPAEWVDEIPTSPSVFKARVVSIAVLMLAGLAAFVYLRMPAALDAFLSRNGGIAILFQGNHTTASLKLVFQLSGVLALLCALGGAAGLVRNRITYQALRLPLLAVYLLVGFYIWITWQACSSILTHALDVDGAKQDSATRHLLWWSVSSPALAMAAYAAWCHAEKPLGVCGVHEHGRRTDGRRPCARRHSHARS
jgi:hypothetical protein